MASLGCQGPWFSLEVRRGPPGPSLKAIRARSSPLELLALVGVRLWVPDGNAKKTSRVAIRGYTDNQSNEALLRKAMTTKFPSTLILMELAEEQSAKNCELRWHITSEFCTLGLPCTTAPFVINGLPERRISLDISRSSIRSPRSKTPCELTGSRLELLQHVPRAAGARP